MSKKQTLEIVKLSTKEILFSILDLATPFFSASSIYRKPVSKYLKQREIDHDKFFERINYLKRMGYIETFVENKEKFIELTPKGVEHAKNIFLDHIEIDITKNWDGKWRVVIFDIPETKRYSRDIFRHKLLELGFIQIQKSVYVFPYECTDEISTLSSLLNISESVTIMISEIIQGEIKILEHLVNRKVLTQAQIKNLSKNK